MIASLSVSRTVTSLHAMFANLICFYLSSCLVFSSVSASSVVTQENSPIEPASGKTLHSSRTVTVCGYLCFTVCCLCYVFSGLQPVSVVSFAATITRSHTKPSWPDDVYRVTHRLTKNQSWLGVSTTGSWRSNGPCTRAESTS